MPVEDLTGAVFGRLTAQRPITTRSTSGGIYRYRWECLCSCGSLKVVESTHLKSGATRSCGCLIRKAGGATAHPLFRVWANMLARCQDPSNKSYPDYGARGVSVCPEWQDFWSFAADMGDRPDGWTLERKDNSKGYGPENCVWADRTTQANNKRNVPLLEHEGLRLSIPQWARQYGLPVETLRSRVKRGVPLPEALRGSGNPT